MSIFLPFVDGFVVGGMVYGSIDNIKEKNFNNRKKYVLYNFVNSSRRNPKMLVLLPLVGGFVEGGMVDGSIDKINFF